MTKAKSKRLLSLLLSLALVFTMVSPALAADTIIGEVSETMATVNASSDSTYSDARMEYRAKYGVVVNQDFSNVTAVKDYKANNTGDNVATIEISDDYLDGALTLTTTNTSGQNNTIRMRTSITSLSEGTGLYYEIQSTVALSSSALSLYATDSTVSDLSNQANTTTGVGKQIASGLNYLTLIDSTSGNYVYAVMVPWTALSDEASIGEGQVLTMSVYYANTVLTYGSVIAFDNIGTYDTSNTNVAYNTTTGTAYESLQTAINEANGATIKLVSDVALDTQLSVSNTVTLDLNGYTISRGDTNTTAALIAISSTGNLTVQDTSDDADGSIDGATYEVDGTTYIGYGIYMTGGTMNVNSGTVAGYRAIYGSAGTLNITGGTVSGTQIGVMADGTLAVNISDSAVVYASGASTTWAVYTYQNTYTGTTTISGGTIGNNVSTYAVSAWGGTVNITAGTLTGTATAVTAYYTTTMTIGSSETTPVITGASGNGVEVGSGATVTINSGTITGYNCGVLILGATTTSDDPTYTTLVVNGGSITGQTNCGIQSNGSRYYTNITVNDGTIYGYYCGMYLPAMESTTTVTGGTIYGLWSGIEIRAGELNVSGGNIYSTSTTFSTSERSGATVIGAGIAVAQYSGQTVKVNITDGTISGYYGVYEWNYNSDVTSEVSISISGSSTSVTATGSDGAAVYSKSVSNSTNDHTTVSISGGTYSSDVSAYVVATSTQTEGESTYTVTPLTESDAVASVTSGEDVTYYSSLSAAISAATTSGDTVTLLKDYSSTTVTIAESQNITLDLGGHTLTFTSGTSVYVSTSLGSITAGLVNNGILTIQNGTVKRSSARTVANTDTGVLTVASSASITGSVAVTNVGGTVTTSGTLTATTSYAMQTYGGTVYVTGGTLTPASSSYNAVAIFNRTYDTTSGTEVAANVYISGGILYGVVGTNNQRSGDSNLTITGGTIKSANICVYWPSSGTLTIGTSGSTDDSSPVLTSTGSSAIVICCGTMNIYSGTIQATYAANDRTPFDSTYYASYYRNTGTIGLADAVTIMANRNSSYAAYGLTVNLAGGTYYSASNYAVRYADCNEASDSDTTDTSQTVNISITGGTYTGGTTTNGDAVAAIDESCVATENQGIISGGHFSTAVPSSYCADGSKPYTETDGDYVTANIPYTVEGFYISNSSDGTAVIPASIASGYESSTIYVKVSASYLGGSNYTINNYPTTTLTYTDSDGKVHTYIFAGWYTAPDGEYDSICGTDMWNSLSSYDYYYAKFVDADVLSVGVQYDTEHTDTYTNLRFVSSVDTLYYSSTGFDFTLSGIGTTSLTTTDVYEEITGTTMTYAATYFSDASTYFVTKVLLNVTSGYFDTEMTVMAYWVTCDGTKVTGETKTFKVSDLISGSGSSDN